MKKNVTLSAEETLINKARDKARGQKTTLNAVFREWLARYVSQANDGKDYAELMQRLSYARPGRTFSRAEMNER
ncbi:MAG: hypothetical protein ACE5HV_04860 [Acidobacteriota bacterium]